MLQPRTERLVILGATPAAFELIEELSRQPRGRPRAHVIGWVADSAAVEAAPARCRWLGPTAKLASVLRRARADRLVVALAERRGQVPFRQLLDAKLRGLVVETIEDAYERLTGKVAITELTPGAVLLSAAFGRRSRALSLAGLVGRLAAALLIVLTLPLFALIALAIRLDSGGPVLFVQERVGLRGRPFRLFKFRTMHAAAAASEWVCDNGHRVTRVGAWLRRFRLDELPQLVNVVRGEMTLVGPRPHPQSNYALLATVMRNMPERGFEIPYYSLRTLVPPGITGWAQVRYGYANGVAEEVEKLRFDLYYLKHRSCALDVRILSATLGAVLRRQPRQSPRPRGTVASGRVLRQSS
ncbi:MAG TPA: sugar transferase [Candidatus Polarisedimenticolaceae bacterium]|nr:sugar transferase [Candidatus Polarisedimenticolaceae bacterium]